MILELALTYLPVLVIGLFWALAMRPLLRLTHLSPFAAPGHLRRSRSPGPRPRGRPGRRPVP